MMRKLLFLLVILFVGCTTVEEIANQYRSDKVVHYYTKKIQNNKPIYEPYRPSESEVQENMWLTHYSESDTIYIVRRVFPGGWSSFSEASEQEVYRIKKSNAIMPILRSN